MMMSEIHQLFIRQINKMKLKKEGTCIGNRPAVLVNVRVLVLLPR